MKSRIVIALSVTLAVLLLVVGVVPKAMPTSPVLADELRYQYSVPFTCGTAVNEVEGVKPGNYATTVDIHNPGAQGFPGLANVYYKVVRSFPSDKVTEWRHTTISNDHTMCIRCKQIYIMLNMGWPPPKYITGFVVIQSPVPLDVYGVYTTVGSYDPSIDVESIEPVEVWVLI